VRVTHDFDYLRYRASHHDVIEKQIRNKTMKNLGPRWLLPLVLVTVVGGGFGIAANAQAAPPGLRHTSRDFSPHHIFKLLHRLDVNREQSTQIGAVMDAHRPLMREFMFDMKDGKKALQAILTSDNYDPQQIEDLAAKQAAIAEKMFRATAKSFADISAILTAEQRKELAAMMAEHENRRRRGPPGGPGGDREPM
jgi:Spy/CpxP family protein refolding chaperone